MSRRVGSVDEAVLDDKCGLVISAALLVAVTMLDAFVRAELVDGVRSFLIVKAKND